MKNLGSFLILCSIAGCVSNPLKWFMGEGTVSSEDKADVAKHALTLDALNAQYGIWQYVALICVGLGLTIVVASFMTNQFLPIRTGKDKLLGIGLVVFGGLCSWWGGYAPTHQNELGLGMVCVLAITIGYLIYKNQQHKRHFHSEIRHGQSLDIK